MRLPRAKGRFRGSAQTTDSGFAVPVTNNIQFRTFTAGHEITNESRCVPGLHVSAQGPSIRSEVHTEMHLGAVGLGF